MVVVSCFVLNIACTFKQRYSTMCDPSHQLSKIYTLTTEQLVDFLKENGFGSEVCQIFTGKAVRYNY